MESKSWFFPLADSCSCKSYEANQERHIWSERSPSSSIAPSFCSRKLPSYARLRQGHNPNMFDSFAFPHGFMSPFFFPYSPMTHHSPLPHAHWLKIFDFKLPPALSKLLAAIYNYNEQRFTQEWGGGCPSLRVLPLQRRKCRSWSGPDMCRPSIVRQRSVNGWSRAAFRRAKPTQPGKENHKKVNMYVSWICILILLLF